MINYYKLVLVDSEKMKTQFYAYMHCSQNKTLTGKQFLIVKGIIT